jgi:GT2 family glycosyltransferase
VASVSVVIPSLDAPGIGRALAALRAQLGPLPPWEVIGVGRDAAGLVEPFAELSWIDTGEPRPPAVARNLGAARATGEVLCFLDADCVPEPRWLATLLAAFQDPAVSVVGGGVTFGAENYWTLADNIATFYPYLAARPPGERDQLPSLNLAVRRSTWEAVGPFDERYPFPAAEDSDWCTRARLAGHRLRFLPAAVVRHEPSRASAGALWRHAVRFGASSIKVDPRHRAALGRPWPLAHWTLTLALSPLLAAAVTLRAFAGCRWLWRYAHTAPAVWLAKLGWCWGAARSLRAGAPWEAPAAHA